jgi:3-hydroxy-9,10-secoandrosta-1,3,5(10)-triene-9,17-dione monooxygenase
MTVPTRASVLADAASHVPFLAEHADDVDRRRRLSPEVVERLTGSGLLRLSNPLRFGGTGDFDLTLTALGELARGSAAAAWCAAVWTQHNYQLGRWPLAGQEDYFADGLDVLCSSAYVAKDARVVPEPGGHRLSGTWKFSSGCDHASWMMLSAVADGVGPAFFLVAPGDWEALDTWHSAGLKGTGSNDVVVDGAFVPDHRILPLSDFAEGDPNTDDRASYRVTPWPLVGMALAFVVLGAAQGAVDALERGAAPDDDAAFTGIAESTAEIDTALSLCWRDVDSVLERAETHGRLTMEERVRLARNRTFAVQLGMRAVNRVFSLSGIDGTREGAAIQRFHRDAHAGSHQPALAWDLHAVHYGRARLGLEVRARMV